MTHSLNPHAELRELIRSVQLDQATPEQVARLEELLSDDPEARRLYIRSMHLVASLSWYEAHDDGIASHTVVPPLLSPSDLQVPSSKPLVAPPESTGGWGGLLPDTAQLSRWFEIAPVVITGLLVVVFGFFVAVKRFGKTPPVPIADRMATHDTDGVVTNGGDEFVATLQSTVGATWQGTKLPTTSGSRLVHGTLQLHSGIAQIEFDSGAIVVIHGPTTFDIRSRNFGFLRTGKLLARVPGSAVGFTIETPSARVVDLGTEFGVVANASQKTDSFETEVHVFEGKVDLVPRSGGVSLAMRRQLTEGQAARLEVPRHGPALSSFVWHELASKRGDFSRFGIFVPLRNTTATFSQRFARDMTINDFSIDNILVQNNDGWAIYNGEKPDPTTDQTAVFETTHDIGFVGGTLLTFTLDHHDLTNLKHGIGRFRISLTTDDRSQFADGLVENGDVMAHWTLPDIVNFRSVGGATMTELEDKSILVSGETPSSDTYIITMHTMLTGITGFRLEAISDPSLPANGPGRFLNGNFVLTHFAVTAYPRNTSGVRADD